MVVVTKPWPKYEDGALEGLEVRIAPSSREGQTGLTMQKIKQLLIQQINEYDQKAAECCAHIVNAALTNKTESNEAKARMMSCIASREALRHFGETSGLLSTDETTKPKQEATNWPRRF